MSQNKTDELIKNLGEDLKAQKPLKHPALRLAPWVILVFVYVIFMAYHNGIRGDIEEKLNDAIFLYEVISAALIVLSAASASLWLCVPDIRGQRWVLAVPLTLFANFLIWLCVKACEEGVHFPAFHVDHCMYEGFYMMGVPAAALMFISYRGSTTHPYLMVFMNMLCASFIAYLGLRFTCMMDTIGHSFVYHIIPYVVAGTIIGTLARKIYKW